MPLSLTIDAAFFDVTAMPALGRLYQWSTVERLSLFASRFPYHAEHQGAAFVDPQRIYAHTSPLPRLGADLNEAEVVQQYQVGLDGSPEYNARLNGSMVAELQALSVGICGKRSLNAYQQYRLMALLEHREAGNELFVTTDLRKLFSKHANKSLVDFGVLVVDPPAAIARCAAARP